MVINLISVLVAIISSFIIFHHLDLTFVIICNQLVFFHLKFYITTQGYKSLCKYSFAPNTSKFTC